MDVDTTRKKGSHQLFDQFAGRGAAVHFTRYSDCQVDWFSNVIWSSAHADIQPWIYLILLFWENLPALTQVVAGQSWKSWSGWFSPIILSTTLFWFAKDQDYEGFMPMKWNQTWQLAIHLTFQHSYPSQERRGSSVPKSWTFWWPGLSEVSNILNNAQNPSPVPTTSNNTRW